MFCLVYCDIYFFVISNCFNVHIKNVKMCNLFIGGGFKHILLMKYMFLKMCKIARNLFKS